MLKTITSLSLTVILALVCFSSVFKEMHLAYAADLPRDYLKISLGSTSANSSIEWSKVDQSLIEAVINTHNITAELAASELDYWVNSLMEKVDDKFLNWYFSYINQKTMEFGVPFLWLLYAYNYQFNLFRTEGQKVPSPNQLIKVRMIRDFENKFNELVLDPFKAQITLQRLTERIIQSYSSAIGTKFALVKNLYKIPEQDWERHVSALATVTYDTGTSRSSLASDSIADSLMSDLMAVTTAAVGSKLALNVVNKAATKIAGKVAGAAATKIGAQILDPILVIGILFWDTWDYNRMVKKSRPILRENILDYLTEIKLSILCSPDNSILAAIEKIEKNLITALESYN